MGYRQADGRFTVTGSGDIAPDVAGGAGAADFPTATIEDHLLGTFAGLIVIVVIGVMFITTEYRRGLIRATLAASPRRGQVLVAKAVVLGSVSFVAALAASAIAVTVGVRESRGQGDYVLPVSWLTELRVIVGSAALLAVAAVLALAVGTVLRRSAAAVTTVIVGIAATYLLGTTSVLPAGAEGWLLRVSPAAGFAIQQSIPQYAQVSAQYAPPVYFPLPPWAGFARALRLRRGRARSGIRPAAQEGRMRYPLHAEWTKLRTLPGTLWLLAAAAVLTAAVSTAAAAATRCPRGLACPVDPAKLSLTGVQFGQAVVAIVAVLAVSGEYSTGMIRASLTAVPHRATMLAAKATAVTGPVLAAAAAGVLGSILAGRAAPARRRVHRGPRVPGPLPGRRASAAGHRRVGPLPGSHRPAGVGHRHRRAGHRRSHRQHARPALPVPDCRGDGG